MAQETQSPAAAPATAAEVEPVKCSTPAAEPVEEKEKEKEKEEKKDVGAGDDGVEAKDKSKETVIQQSTSFKEESNVVADLSDHEQKALDELKLLIIAALAKHEFTKPPVKEEKKEEEVEEKKEEGGDKKEEEKKEEVGEEKKEEVREEKKEEVVIVETHDQPKESKKEGVEETKKGKEPMKPEPCAPAKEEKPAAEGKKEVDAAAKTVETIETKKGKEPMKPEPCAPAKEEKPAATPVAEEKKEVVDGTKTVEAIETTVVQATVSATQEIVKEGKKSEAAEVVEEEKIKPHETGVPAGEEEKEDIPPPPPEEVFIWGVPLHGSEKSDTILLKFLRARDFKAKEALTMIKNTVMWRKKYGIEELLEEDLGLPELGKAMFMRGLDKGQHPIFYSVFEEFQDKEMYRKTFGDVQKREHALKWMVQLLEKETREKLDFSPEGVCTIVQVNDFKNSTLLWKKELRQTTIEAIHLLQNNYPEFAAKQIFINVSWWFLPFIRMLAPFFTGRSKSKCVYAGPSRSPETLFKYIAPEQVPVQYGGLSVDGDSEFCTADPVSLVNIKPASKHSIEIPVTEACIIVWELRVLAWDVSYGAEFAPDAEGGYNVIVQKMRKFISTDEAVEKNSFKISEPGKVILTIDNATSKKKKLLYRYKTKQN